MLSISGKEEYYVRTNGLERKVVAFIIVALVIGGIVGYYSAQSHGEVENVKIELATLQSDYTELDSLYTTLSVEYHGT